MTKNNQAPLDEGEAYDGRAVPASPRREPLTKERILQHALRLVDEEGLAALSMRRLAGELGFDTMALYRHFPNKAAMVDGLMEAAFLEITPPSEQGDVWERLREVARAFRRVAHAHPHLGINNLRLGLERLVVPCDHQRNVSLHRKRAYRIHVATVPGNIGESAHYSRVCLKIDCFNGRRKRITRTAALFAMITRKLMIICFFK